MHLIAMKRFISPAAEIGFISIFILLVILYMLIVRSVIFDVCDIAVMHF